MSYTIEQFRADLSEPYVWPGGYPRYFITNDGAALCYEAATENQELIEQAINENSRDGWRVVACDVNWENTDLYCDHTGKQIESAYGED